MRPLQTRDEKHQSHLSYSKLQQNIVWLNASHCQHSSVNFFAVYILQKNLLTTERLSQLQSSCGYESFTLVLETNWIRQASRKASDLMRKQPCPVHLAINWQSSGTSVRESLQVYFKVAVRNFHAFNASRWFPHMLVVTMWLYNDQVCCLSACLVQLVSNSKINPLSFLQPG